MARPHENIKFGMDEVKELVNTRVVKAVIIEIDRSKNTADIETSKWGRVDDVPFFYHCAGEDNVKRGHEAFFEDDEVYVVCVNAREYPDSVPEMKIVAHTDRRYPCYGYLVIQYGECFTAWDVFNQRVPVVMLNEGTEDEVEIKFPCDRETVQPWLDSMARIREDGSRPVAGVYKEQFWLGSATYKTVRPDCNVPHVWTWDWSTRSFAYDPPCHTMVCDLIADPNWDCEFIWHAPIDYRGQYGGFASVHATEGYEEVDAYTHMATNWGGAWNLKFTRERPGIPSVTTYGHIHQRRFWTRVRDGFTATLSVQHDIITPLRNPDGSQATISLPWTDSLLIYGERSADHVYEGYLCSGVGVSYYEGLRPSNPSEWFYPLEGIDPLEGIASSNRPLIAYEHSQKNDYPFGEDRNDKLMGVTYFVPTMTGSPGDIATGHPWMNVAQIYMVDTFRIAGEATEEVFQTNCPYPTENEHEHRVLAVAACENVTSSAYMNFNPFAQQNDPRVVSAIEALVGYARNYHLVASDMLGPSKWDPPKTKSICEGIAHCVWSEWPHFDQHIWDDNQTECEDNGYLWFNGSIVYPPKPNECVLPRTREKCEAVGGWWQLGVCVWPGDCTLPTNKEDCLESGNTWDEDVNPPVCSHNPHNSYLHMNIQFAPFPYNPNYPEWTYYGFEYGIRQARTREL